MVGSLADVLPGVSGRRYLALPCRRCSSAASGHAPVAPHGERDEHGQEAGDPGDCAAEGGWCSGDEGEGARRVRGQVTGLTFATACSQLGRVETGTNTELANTSGNRTTKPAV